MSYNDAGGGGRPLSEKWSDLLTVKDKKHEIWELKGATELHRLALEDFSQLERRAEEIDEAIVNATCTIMDGYYKEAGSAPSIQVTPLFLACASRSWDSALLLLSKGADPNKTATDKDGNVLTPLSLAITNGSIDVCRSLLESGAKQDPLTSESENMKEVKKAYPPSISFPRSHPCFSPARLKPGT